MCTLRDVLKTSVYLSADLKARLAQVAPRLGLTEAAFIRRAIEAALRGSRVPHAGPIRSLVLSGGGRCILTIARQLSSAHHINGTVVGELMGLPGERRAPIDDFVDRPANYLASSIAPASSA